MAGPVTAGDSTWEVWISDTITPGADDSFEAYFNPTNITWPIVFPALTKYNTINGITDENKAGQVQTLLSLQNIIWDRASPDGDHWETLLRCLRKWSEGNNGKGDPLYLSVKDGETSYNMVQWAKSDYTDVEQMQVKVGKLNVKKMEAPKWTFDMTIVRTKPADQIE